MDDVTLDERRGIQGAKRRGPEERLESARSSQTVQGRYLGGREGLVREKKQKQEAGQEENRALVLDEEAQQQAMLKAQQVINKAQLSSLLVQKKINAQKEAAKILLEKAKKTKLLASRSVAKSGIAIACSIFMFAFPLAVLSAIGFALHGEVRGFEEGLGKMALVGGVLKWVVGLVTQFLPFELVGYVAWAGVIILLLPAFFGYFIWFAILQLNPIGSQFAFLITSVCILLSMCPIINIFPWIVVWVIYMSFFAPSA